MKTAMIGDTAPPFKQKAFPTNRQFQVPHPDGVPVLLLFVGYQTAAKIEGIISGIRRIVADPDQLLILTVVDLQNVPRLMQSAAKKVIKAAYDQAAKHIPPNYDPETQLILLTDWKGKIGHHYQINDVNEQLALVLINANGRIQDRYQGQDVQKAALDMVLTLLKTGNEA